MHVSSEEFLDIQATIECRFTLKCIRDMIITYNHLTQLSKKHLFHEFRPVCNSVFNIQNPKATRKIMALTKSFK